MHNINPYKTAYVHTGFNFFEDKLLSPLVLFGALAPSRASAILVSVSFPNLNWDVDTDASRASRDTIVTVESRSIPPRDWLALLLRKEVQLSEKVSGNFA